MALKIVVRIIYAMSATMVYTDQSDTGKHHQKMKKKCKCQTSSQIKLSMPKQMLLH